MRVQKQVTDANNNTVTYTYEYNGSTLIKETRGSDVIWYIYDNAGSPLGFSYNNSIYYYIKSIQGDITGIMDESGAIITAYYYDAWGNCTNLSSFAEGSIGLINPFLYRGYYYDSDLGLYYLQSRFYDAVTHRFINADAFASTGQGILGYNMFAYCGNNPICRSDTTGQFWGKVADFFVTAVATVVSVVVGCVVAKAAASVGASPTISKAAGTGAALATFGLVNNTVNAIYYNYISDGQSNIEKDPEKSTYTERYVTRWERLDHTKQETQESTYNLNAWRYQSEYSLHMYGWYATGWAYSKDIPVISGFAESFYHANIFVDEFDGRPHVDIGTVIVGIFGM